MSNYTMTIQEIINNGVEIFDFNYSFYNDNKEDFENKFIDMFMYYEIGFDNLEMFKHFLKSKLNTIYPYYKKLYQTELRTNDIDFMLNKDLTETIKKDVNVEDTKQITNTGSNNTTNTDENIYSESSKITNKESNVNNGISSVDLNSESLTSVSENNETNNYTNTDNSQINLEYNDDTTHTGTENISEVTELVSKGNIGITSSAELLEKWRSVIIDIDMMILNDLSTLFLKIY